MELRQIFDFAIPFLERLPVIRVILGIIIMFFLPGFTWSLVFFRGINVVERLVLSIGLSVAIITLSILALNKLLGIRITGANSLLIIIVITVIPLAFYYIGRLVKK